MLAFYSRRCLATHLVTELASPPFLSYYSMFNRHTLLLQTLVTSTSQQIGFAPQNAHHECFLCARRVSPWPVCLLRNIFIPTCTTANPRNLSHSAKLAFWRTDAPAHTPPQTALFVYPPILPFINAPALPATKKPQQYTYCCLSARAIATVSRATLLLPRVCSFSSEAASGTP